jgi:hypothetical protein
MPLARLNLTATCRGAAEEGLGEGWEELGGRGGYGSGLGETTGDLSLMQVRHNPGLNIDTQELGAAAAVCCRVLGGLGVPGGRSPVAVLCLGLLAGWVGSLGIAKELG